MTEWSSVQCRCIASSLCRSQSRLTEQSSCKVLHFYRILSSPHSDDVLLTGVQLTAMWFPETGCLPTHLHSTNLAISFAYSVALDFIIVLLCAGQILRVNTSRSRLLSLMYRDGLTCFIVAYVISPPSVFRIRLPLTFSIPVFRGISERW